MSFDSEMFATATSSLDVLFQGRVVDRFRRTRMFDHLSRQAGMAGDAQTGTKPGNWTFVIVTDRAELDRQIADTFVNCGATAKEREDIQAQSREHLKALLQGNERYVFTLNQKFGTAQGETFPKLSERSDIIVITDEAHRSQYAVLAANMRCALPNAAFIAFTGGSASATSGCACDAVSRALLDGRAKGDDNACGSHPSTWRTTNANRICDCGFLGGGSVTPHRT